MQKQNAFMNVIVKKFAGAARRLHPRPPESLPRLSHRGKAVAASPAFSNRVGRGVLTAPRRAEDSPPHHVWPQEDCANEPSPLHCFGEQRALWALAAKVSLILVLLVASLSSQAAVREVGEIGLTVNDLGRELHFYTNTLPFELISISEASGKEQDDLLGLKSVKVRVAALRLGDESITLTEHFGNKGRPIPQDSRSFDHWFQHIAIVVRDMDKAYAHLLAHKVKHVSTAPQTLPAWNKDAGGIKAFYFRDPEDHVLEIIWFPAGKGNSKWQSPTDKVFLGIDHTAIVVSDTDKSLAFYTNVLGLRVVGGAENYGMEQEHLNQVFGARLLITALRAEGGPGIEFLEYIAPPGGRKFPDDTRANDLVFWHTHLSVTDYEFLSDSRGGMHARPVSFSGASGSFIIRDPDGHALQLDDLRSVRHTKARVDNRDTANAK